MSQQTVCAFDDLVNAVTDRLKESKKMRKKKKWKNGKKSKNAFLSNSDKKKFHFEQFMKNYKKLPSHLRSKYELANVGSIKSDYDKLDVSDFEPMATQICANPKADFERAEFGDSINSESYYLHFPSFKKRKISKTESSPKLADKLCQNEKNANFVWTHYDELASYYFCRYLYFCSMTICDHWRYANKNEKFEKKRIFMAEFKRSEDLERHLSIKSPDERISDKYWYQRYRFFSLFDEGIKLDIESWHSVTPEVIAKDIAEKCACRVIVDAMCGAGGNSIAFAQVCDFVIAIDIDLEKIKMAKHNAKIYGVEDKIQFIAADFFSFAPMLKQFGFINVIFLSPPWGGMFYQKKLFDLRQLADNGEMDGTELFKICKEITPNIAYYLPKNTNYKQLKALAKPCKIERNKLFKKVKAITAYYGDLPFKN